MSVVILKHAAPALALSVALSVAPHPATAASSHHAYDLQWTIHVDHVPKGAREARVWISVPQSLEEQRVTGLEVKTDHPWKYVEDATFHNRVALVTVRDPEPSFSIALAAHVERSSVDAPRPAKLSARERGLYLRKEALVSLSPRIHAIADSVGRGNRARYDYVLSAMDYDKTVPGWGHGDSERACDIGKGNCTDFHSLFMSLSRAEGVPAMFEMGYATLPGGETDHIGGYHCWAWFYDDASKAWVPVDISEADQHPDRTDYLFGHLDADRITFSRGRDVKLPGMKGAPLNYLPPGAYVEVDGHPLDGVTRTISYTVDGGATTAGS